MTALRLAIAGAGQIGRAHAERIRATPGCTLAAIADPSSAAAAWVREMGVPGFATLEEMLATTQLDGVILATPNALHVSGALDCLRHRVPVLVEKPVADSLAEAQQLVTVNGSATFRKPDSYFSEGPWRTQRGGGPILINLVHEIDNLRTLVGDIVEVQALASSAARGFEVEDTVAINLRFANGVLGTFLLSDAAASPRSWEQTSGENKRYDRHADEDCYVIAGDRGSLEVPTMRLRRYAGPASWWEPMATEVIAVPELDPLQQQLLHFCAVIRGEAQPLVTAADAARTLEVTLAVAQAAATRQPMRLAA